MFPTFMNSHVFWPAPRPDPAGQPSSRTAGRQPASQPASQPAGRPASRPATQSASHPITQRTGQPASQPSKPSGWGGGPAQRDAARRRARPASLCALRGLVGPESSRGDPVSSGKGCGVVDLVPEGADSVHCQAHSLQVHNFMLFHGLSF